MRESRDNITPSIIRAARGRDGVEISSGCKMRCLVLTAAVSGLKRLKCVRAASLRAARSDADFLRRALVQTGGSGSLQSQNTTAKRSGREGVLYYFMDAPTT